MDGQRSTVVFRGGSYLKRVPNDTMPMRRRLRFRGARIGYVLFCLLLGVVVYYALRKHAPPEFWDALRSTYMQQEEESGH